MHDLVCFSHLRWQFVFQRPQHLLTRFGRTQSVLYFEEPIWADGPSHLKSESGARGVEVLTPVLQHGIEGDAAERVQSALVEKALADRRVRDYVLWFYTPMAVGVARGLDPKAVVYDCMDELSAFKNADPELVSRERELMSMADLVFTGGYSLYESKHGQHSNVHPFPSSVDVPHFAAARRIQRDCLDQAHVPRPRFGFYGVLDERLDVALLDGLARARPDWHFVLLGPVVKIDEADLPRHPNVHYLGARSYDELPAYLAGWDVAIMPFARNASTRFISPTKTPEYLAAGKPVVSTSIRDVVRTYGERGLCHVADTVEEFVAASERALLDRGNELRQQRVDAFLAQHSWDRTFQQMSAFVDAALRKRSQASGARLKTREVTSPRAPGAGPSVSRGEE